MASKDCDSRMQGSKTDDFIQDYLSDIWGSPAEPNLKAEVTAENSNESLKEDLSSSLSPTALDTCEVKTSETFVQCNFTPLQNPLIPTIKLYKHDEPQKVRSQQESMLVLLTCLYFLRRPLPPKVRKFILNLSEQTVDDFNAAYWVELPTELGVKNEV